MPQNHLKPNATWREEEALKNIRVCVRVCYHDISFGARTKTKTNEFSAKKSLIRRSEYARDVRLGCITILLFFMFK